MSIQHNMLLLKREQILSATFVQNFAQFSLQLFEMDVKKCIL